MRFSLPATLLMLGALTSALPTSDAEISANPQYNLMKRSACSSGIKINCGSASMACSNNVCSACCGSCCQCVTGTLKTFLIFFKSLSVSFVWNRMKMMTDDAFV